MKHYLLKAELYNPCLISEGLLPSRFHQSWIISAFTDYLGRIHQKWIIDVSLGMDYPQIGESFFSVV